MNQFLKEKENHYLIYNIDEENSINQKEGLNQIIDLYTTNEFNIPKKDNKLINNKRGKNAVEESNRKHTKYSYDNLKRECKHLVIENLMKFINEKIYKAYEGNIGKGFAKKKLFKLNQSQKINADVEFNKIFITKTLKEILSQNITKKARFYDLDHNKNIINTIISEKKDKFEKLFNLTFIECSDHFIENKQIEELNGLKLFSELREQILNKYEEDGESYYENLKIFLKDFKNKINRAKPRKKRNKNSLNNVK